MSDNTRSNLYDEIHVTSREIWDALEAGGAIEKRSYTMDDNSTATAIAQSVTAIGETVAPILASVDAAIGLVVALHHRHGRELAGDVREALEQHASRLQRHPRAIAPALETHDARTDAGQLE